MSVEMVLMIPILVMFMLLVAAGGRFVSIQADVQSAARDAARAASYERSPAAARLAAATAVSSQLKKSWSCRPTSINTSDFRAGGVVEVVVDCSVSVDDLGMIGLGGSVRMQGEGAAPLDSYRRTG